MLNLASLVIKMPLKRQTSAIQKDRQRTNLLMPLEQPALLYLCSVMPAWVTPNILTTVGMVGSFIAAAGLALAKYEPLFLLLSIAGFGIQWFGDSLDGRLAYYRNIPRKWYGFTLDLCMDWISTTLIGVGFYFFLPAAYKVIAMILVASYGWAMLMAIIKYKLTDKYQIDSGILGPTEFRVILSLMLVLEIFVSGSLIISGGIVTLILIGINIKDFFLLLNNGNERDDALKKEKTVAQRRA